MQTQNISFKGYMPVEFYARHPRTGYYVPVLKKENIRKCQRFVINNLNNPNKKNANQTFIEKYKNQDKDYARNPVVASVYEQGNSMVHMASGYDALVIKEMGKNLGRNRKEAYDETGIYNSSESRFLARNYFSNALKYIKNMCSRVKDKDGTPIKMTVYFKPIYGKNKELDKFEYEDVKFSITPV